jgi:hypothetical protein
MRRHRSSRRRSRGGRRLWGATALVVSLGVGAGVIIASGSGAPQTPALQTSAWVQREHPGWGHGGYVMMPGPGQEATVYASASQQVRQRLSVQRENPGQWLASYRRQHSQESRYWRSHRRQILQEYQYLLNLWRHHHRGGHTPPPTVAPTATPTAIATATTMAAPTATATTTATPSPSATVPTATASAAPTATATTAQPTTSPTATATAAPSPTATATATATASATATPTASPTTTTATGVTQATSQTWAGYAATGAAGTFTSVAASWMVPPVTCNGATTRSSYAVGLDGDGTSTIEQIGTEGDCAGDFPLYSAWFQMFPNAPVFFKNPVKPGDAMTASVTSLGGGNFMLTLFDMTQNWTQITEQTSAAATLGSAEVVAEDPLLNGQAQPLSNFGIVDFLGAAINNAAIAAPINEVTLQSMAGDTLAVPSTITGGVGNFSVGWDASA